MKECTPMQKTQEWIDRKYLKFFEYAATFKSSCSFRCYSIIPSTKDFVHIVKVELSAA
jgi:hypothetical protein